MHQAAANFIRWAREYLIKEDYTDAISLSEWNVVEIGSRDINGRASTFWGPHGSWWGIDIAPGPNVDVVGDAEDILAGLPEDAPTYDLAISAEVFEHAENWRGILQRMTEQADYVVVTCAGDGRVPHSAVDGMQVRHGEYYANVSEDEMYEALHKCGANVLILEHNKRDGDLYVLASST